MIRLAAVCALLLAAPVHAQNFAPRDECGGLQGIEQFRMQLVTAVANRNADMLEPLVDPDIHLDFGGGSGWEQMSMLLHSEEQALWESLAEVLALGCASSEYGLSMPWVWTQDLGFEDAYTTYLVRGADVPLRSSPEDEAAILRRLDWEAVSLLSDWSNEDRYARVRTADGDRGFVPWDVLRSQIDYRLLASRQDDRWQITVFIAGD